MKKLAAFIMLIFVFLFVCGCDETNGPTESAFKGEPIQSPPQPIAFDSLEDIVSFLKAPDLSQYESGSITDKRVEAYEDMVSRFVQDGYVTLVDNKSSDLSITSYGLRPQARYEDVGIAYRLDHNGINYVVVIYNISPEHTEGQNSGFTDYIDYHSIRYNTDPNTTPELPRAVALNGDNMYFIYDADGTRVSMRMMIDPTHYCDVFMSATETKERDIEIFTAFINEISFLKYELK